MQAASVIGDVGRFTAARGCGLAKREPCGRAPASTLAHAEARKHPHNRRRHDDAGYELGSGEVALRRLTNCQSCGSGCSFDPGSGEAALRRSASANLASEQRDNALVRPCSCLKSGAALSPDVAVRQRLSQFTNASVGYLRADEEQYLQALQSGEFLQPRIGYQRFGQDQLFQVLQCCQFLQPHVGYLRARQVQPLQVLQSRQFLQPRVRYSRDEQVQSLQVLQSGQLLQPRIGYLRARQVQRLQVLQSGQFL